MKWFSLLYWAMSMHVAQFQLMGNLVLKMWSFAIMCTQLSDHRFLFQSDLHL